MRSLLLSCTNLSRISAQIVSRCALGVLCALSLASVQAQNISVVVGTGFSGSTGDGGAATSATLNGLNGLALDRFGNLYIADSLNHRVRRVGLDGKISTFAGTGNAGFAGDGGAATGAQLNYPVSLAFTFQGELLIADYGNHRIRRVGLDGKISTVAGNGSEGFAGDDGAATAAQLNNPIGVAAGVDGAIYIGDAQNHRVRKVNATGTISTIAGNGTAGFAGDGATATAAQLNFPGALIVDVLGNVLVADYANNRVRKIAADGTISTLAGTGTAGSVGDASQATAAQLNGPFALAFGTNGSVLIADQINGRVRRVARDGVISTIAGGATTSEANLATSVSLISPSGVATDAAGQVWVAERSVHLVRKVSSPLKLLAEYRFAASDYYFYTARDNEKLLLDGTAGWSRTGRALLVNAANDSGSKGITRYFFANVAQNKTRGNHFYTLTDSEIAALNALNPTNAQTAGLPYNEGIEAYAFAPENDACTSGRTPVFRAFRNATIAPDNPAHIFINNVRSYLDVVASGWSGEGIAFCSAVAP
jgi:hypothetical protein